MIGFDLDGCLAETNATTLGIIDRLQIPRSEKDFLYEIFYRDLKPIFAAKEFMHEDDVGIIITARNTHPKSVEEITRRWVHKYFPEFALVFVGNDEKLKNAGKWKEWQEDIVVRKTAAIKERGVYVYYDDSPTIVSGLRRNNVVCMQFGGRILEQYVISMFYASGYVGDS